MKVYSHNLAAIVFVHPRLEFPFILEWVKYVKNLGVTKIYLGIDERNTFGDEHENLDQYKKQYNLHLDDDEVNSLWKEELDKVRKIIELDVNEGYKTKDRCEMYIPQITFLRRMLEKSIDDKIKWVMGFDIDEYPIVGQYDTLIDFLDSLSDDITALAMPQKIYEARWDSRGRPIKNLIKNVTRKYPQLNPLPKPILKPEFAYLKTNHHAFPKTGRLYFTKEHELTYHHYRGVRPALYIGHIDSNNFFMKNREYKGVEKVGIIVIWSPFKDLATSLINKLKKDKKTHISKKSIVNWGDTRSIEDNLLVLKSYAFSKGYRKVVLNAYDPKIGYKHIRRLSSVVDHVIFIDKEVEENRKDKADLHKRKMRKALEGIQLLEIKSDYDIEYILKEI